MFEFMIAECFRCGCLLTANPELVPAVRDSNGVKQPLCLRCVLDIQELQRTMSLPVWPDPLPGAYEPVSVYEGMSDPYES